jgi:hypothetical protein
MKRIVRWIGGLFLALTAFISTAWAFGSHRVEIAVIDSTAGQRSISNPDARYAESR